MKRKPIIFLTGLIAILILIFLSLPRDRMFKDIKSFNGFDNLSPENIVIVYSPTCPLCKKLEPEINAFAESHNTLEGLVSIRKASTVRKITKMLIAEQEISHTPTLLIVTENEIKKIELKNDDDVNKILDENFERLLKEASKKYTNGGK